MLTEAYSRGSQYLNDGGAGATRMTRWLNDAAMEIDDLERWDYRRASTTGTTPLTITDLGAVESVFDSNKNVLVRSDQGVLENEYEDLTTTGTAWYYYLVAGAIKTYPVTTLTLTVTYFKISPVLTGSAAPLMPDRFRGAIIERACAMMYRDQDDPGMAAVCLAESDRIVERMRLVYALQPGPSRQTVTGASGDW